jgi:Transposase
MAGKRKQYSAEFKFKVVLESLQRDTTREEVCRKYAVSSSLDVMMLVRRVLVEEEPHCLKNAGF